jgi:hypothetical protein
MSDALRPMGATEHHDERAVTIATARRIPHIERSGRSFCEAACGVKNSVSASRP